MHQFIEGFLNCGSVLLAVVLLNDLLVSLVILDTVRVIEQHGIQSNLNQFLEVFHHQILFLRFGKFTPKQVKVNLADIKLPGRNDSFCRLFNLNILADDVVDLHHQFHIGDCFSLFLQLAIDSRNGLISFS